MPGRILIIDDSRAIRSIIASTLRQRSLFDEYVEASDGAEGLERAQEGEIDLVLCDLDMPEVDGFEFLRRFRANERNRRVPVLMLSGTDTPKKKVEGFAHGANDYIIKPCDPDELCARVQNYQRLKQLQDQLEAANAQLEAKNAELAEIAITDPLTGLHNRRHFIARASEELHRSRRHKHAFGLLMLDVDHFKRINDTKGHQQGDKVLVAIADVLRTSLRRTDLLARYGGEEFVLCLPETSAPNAMFVGEKLRGAIEAIDVPGLGWKVTVSVGVSAHPCDSAASVDALLQLADAALYRAKAGGRNRVEVAFG